MRISLEDFFFFKSIWVMLKFLCFYLVFPSISRFVISCKLILYLRDVIIFKEGSCDKGTKLYFIFCLAQQFLIYLVLLFIGCICMHYLLYLYSSNCFVFVELSRSLHNLLRILYWQIIIAKSMLKLSSSKGNLLE